MNLSTSSTKAEVNPLVYDFAGAEAEADEDLTLWEQYQKTCYSQNPPIPALSLMKPILSGDEIAAIFPHQHIGIHLPIILDMLLKTKVVNELNLRDNSLGPNCVNSLIEFVRDGESLSVLNISDNPLIGPKAMTELLDGIQECQNLEQLNINHTGCNKNVGPSIARMLAGCNSLLKLWIGQCGLRQSGIEIVQALGAHPKIKKLVMHRNELYMGGRRFAVMLGSNAAKCSTLHKINLASNAITTEMTIAMLRGLVQAPELRKLNLSRNNIGEPAGRAIGIFVSKAPALRKLYLDQNPLLNVTINKIEGQRKLEEDAKKPGASRKKAPKVYTPGCYTILTGISKSQTMRTCRMIGLVVDPDEWEARMAVVRTAKPDVEIIYRAPSEEGFHFRRARPQTAVPQAPPVTDNKKPGTVSRARK